MPRQDWLNPAAGTYQARRLQRRESDVRRMIERVARGPAGGSITPDPGTDTDNIRVDPGVPDVAYVDTTVFQPYGGDPLVLFSSTLVRPDLVNPGVVYLTVTEVGP